MKGNSRRSRRILYVAPDIPVPHTGGFVGGSTRVLKEAESLARRGCEVFIISRRMRGQKKFEKLSDKILTRRVYRGILFPIEDKTNIKEKKGKQRNRKYKVLEKFFFAFYRFILMTYVFYLLLKYKFDIVVERSNEKGIGVIPAKLLGASAVVEVIYKSYTKIQLKLADKIIANSAEIVPNEFRNKVVEMHDGVDPTSFKYDAEGAKEVRKKYGLENKKVVVYVGVLSKGHGPDILIEVAEKLRDDVMFLMVGKDLELLREEAEERGVANRFVFTGFVKHGEVPKYISAADVAVAPYRLTEFMKRKKIPAHMSPIKVFEYMACGKPVVAGDTGIVKELIMETKCGLIAKSDNPEDFAEKIRILIENEGIARELGENGLKAVKNYTWDVIAEEILRTLQPRGKGERKW